MSSKVNVRSIPVLDGKATAQGIEASWESGQWVAIICNKGMVGCGAFDVKLMEKHDQVIATSHGSIEHPLITCDDLLEAKIMEVTKLAREFGVKPGLSGKEAADLLS
jgi:uncharacterized protein YunC (DUF1805 family)